MKALPLRLLAGTLAMTILAGCSSGSSSEDGATFSLPFGVPAVSSETAASQTETSAPEETESFRMTEAPVLTAVPETSSETVTSAEEEVILELDVPTGFDVSFEGTAANVSWDRVEGADCYEVTLEDRSVTVYENKVRVTGTGADTEYTVNVLAVKTENGRIAAISPFAAVYSFSRDGNIGYEPLAELPEDDSQTLRRIEWPSHDGKLNWWTNVTISDAEYEYLRSLPRYTAPAEYHRYIDEPYNRASLKNIAAAIRQVADQNAYSLDQTALEVIRFVQSIPYRTDAESKGLEEYPRFPVETIYDQCGDCEDLSILLAGLLRELNIGCCFIDYPTHIAVAVKASDSSTSWNFEAFGNRFFYVETTDFGWEIGEMPKNRIGEQANIIKVIQ